MGNPNPWVEACKQKLYRPNGGDGELIKLDAGVNYFILALEKLNAETFYSCDGHGDQSSFYVMFKVPRYPLVHKIHSAGFFHIQVENGPRMFSLRLSDAVDIEEVGKNKYRAIRCTDPKKIRGHWKQVLQWASEAWERVLFGKDK